MPAADPHRREIAVRRDSLSRLSEASLRINESLDLDDVFQQVLDSARSLTSAPVKDMGCAAPDSRNRSSATLLPRRCYGMQ